MFLHLTNDALPENLLRMYSHNKTRYYFIFYPAKLILIFICKLFTLELIIFHITLQLYDDIIYIPITLCNF